MNNLLCLASLGSSGLPDRESVGFMFAGGTLFPDQEISDYKGIHLRAQKALDGLLRPAHNGLILVERRVEQHRYARHTLEFPDELPVKWIGVRAHGLETACSVDVRHGRNHGPFARENVTHLEHEGIWIRLAEIVTHRLKKNRRRKRPEGFAVFDPRVQYVLHIRTSGIGQYAPVTECSGTPFHPALKPPQNIAVRNRLGARGGQVLLIMSLVVQFVFPQRPLDGASAETRSGVGMTHNEAARLT